ncbi:MAG: aminotransferase class V-fold PLP-dependent enzyme [Planctomycetes bacterium]|nr:aminotransferase class V-fold PLP-dependent enzyme [Planctomycetota bacterium]
MSDASSGEDLADLELSADTMREMGANVLERCIDHVARLGEAVSCGNVHDIEAIRSARLALPEIGMPIDPLLDRLFGEWIPRSFTTPGPGYFAYVPGGGLYATALADLIAETTNRFVGVWPAAPALAEIEASVIDWIAQWMQFPSAARGLLTSGSSMSTWIAITTARECRLGTRIREGVAYVSRQTHHCVAKALRLAGIAADRVRVVPTDATYRMDLGALRDAIEADRAAGLCPFFAVSTAGSVHFGAVDPMDEVADIAEEYGLWHHVDGAYGGFFHVVPEFRTILRGLPRADSLALDPHKGLFLPYGTGALLVRDGRDLRRVHGASADYLPSNPDDEVYDIASYGPELSRPFRGLRIWLPMMLYGAARFRAAIAEKRSLAVLAHERIAALPNVRVALPPTLSLFAFRIEHPDRSPEDNDRSTRDLIAGVTALGRVMISGCRESGRDFARVCVLSFRSRRTQIEQLVADVAEVAARTGRT